ncbi:RAD protein (Pv-fam-e) [Plasmodium ovale curtisi]|uniref:RAD protein (Pv-fam-e) n=1 Tax=Plasmodium ovale curtisi TaxID=864141 RepID=A0A1A8VTP8_PLAOA|nr:RAD protein (Pv-fam-e) [Plasmodium ovale curtisi]
MNSKKYILLKFAISFLVVLLNIHNRVFPSKLNTRELQSRTSCSRKLAEISRETDSVFKSLKEKYTFPYGCRKADISKNLTKEEMLQTILSYSSFSSKKEIYITVYYYNKYLNGLYKEMVSKLKEEYKNLASTHGISKEDQRIFWTDCQEDLNNYLEKMNDKCHKHLSSRIKGSCMNNKLCFILFLYKYRKRWNNGMKKIEKKWINNFKSQIGKIH